MIGIIGAMAEEIAILKSELQMARTIQIGKLEFISGMLENKKAILLQCGIGKVNAAIGASIMAQCFIRAELEGSFIINSGCAGGTNPEGKTPLNFGDVVVSTSFVQHDFDITAFGHAIGQVPGLPAIFDVDEYLVGKVCYAIDKLKENGKLPDTLNYTQGLVASGDVFMHDSQRIAAVQKLFPDMRALEMEGAAIAQACIQLEIPFVAIRSLSDIAGEESPVTFDEYLPIAAKNSSDIVREIVRLG